MFFKVWFSFLCLQVNSEEHANAEGEATLWTRIIPEEILAKIPGEKEVPADKITVWIDPLDATQEYTGLVQLFIYKSYHHKSGIISSIATLFV